LNKGHLHTDRTVFTRVFAFGTSSFELHTTYAARVVSLVRQIPLPLRNGGVGGVGDLHPQGGRGGAGGDEERVSGVVGDVGSLGLVVDEPCIGAGRNLEAELQCLLV
jgi:hypothetical protein